jgi:hypothetical protein
MGPNGVLKLFLEFFVFLINKKGTKKTFLQQVQSKIKREPFTLCPPFSKVTAPP